MYYQKAAKEWLERAKDDIAWTENNIKAGFYIQACFTAQQVAEKSFKAYLRANKQEIDRNFKTHELSRLVFLCNKLDRGFTKLEKNCRILNEYYAPTRYPEILGLEFRGYGKEQADEAFALAKDIFGFVKNILR